MMKMMMTSPVRMGPHLAVLVQQSYAAGILVAISLSEAHSLLSPSHDQTAITMTVH